MRKTSLPAISLPGTILLASLNPSVWAQSLEGPQSGVLELAPVTVIGSDEAVRFLPGSATYLGVEKIQQYSTTDINRMLRRVPGVYVREEDGYGLFPNISLRGAHTARSENVTLMEDGVLAAPAPYSAPSAYYSPNTGRMSGLEILKGSSQVRFGPQITGGVVNYLSTPIPNLQSTYIKAAYGSFNEVLFHAHHGAVEETRAGEIGYLVEFYGHRTDGFKTIDNTPDFNGGSTGFTRMEPMGKISWTPDTANAQRLELKYAFSDLNADETYLGQTQGDFELNPNRRYQSSRFDNIAAQHHQVILRHEAELREGLKWNNTAYYQSFHRDWFKLNDLRNVGGIAGNNVSLSTALATPGSAAEMLLKGTGTGDLRVRHNNRYYKMAGIQSALNHRFETGPVEHAMETGVRYHFDQEDRFQWDETFTQGIPGVVTARTVGAAGSAGDRIQRSHALALHALDSMEIGKLTLTPGLRFETVGQSYEDDFRRTDAGAPAPVSGQQRLNVWSAGMGGLYRINSHLNLLASFHRGFSVPGPRGAIRSNLKEETSYAYEAGMRYRGDSGFQAEVIGFYTQFRNLIVGGNLGGGGAATTENVGSVDSLGVEISVSYDPGTALGWVVRTPMHAGITLTDAHLVGNATNTDPESIFDGGRDGSRVPYIPEYQFFAELGVGYDRYSLSLNGSYVPGTYTTAANSRTPINASGTPDARVGRTDAYLVMDLVANVQIHPTLRLFGSIRNLLDQQYVASRHPHGPRPGLPLTFLAGLEWKF